MTEAMDRYAAELIPPAPTAQDKARAAHLIVDVEVPIGPGTDDTDLGVLRLDDIEARDPNLTTAAVPLPIDVPAPLHVRNAWDFRTTGTHDEG